MQENFKFDVAKTGIKGLDEVLGGGIAQGHMILLRGRAGTGKTIPSMQWLFEGLKKFEDSGMYIAVTEPFTKALKNTSTMGFYDKSLLSSGKLRFTDMRSMLDLIDFGDSGLNSWTKKDIERLVEQIEKIVDESNVQRLIIDSITAIGYMIDDKELLRYFIFRLGTVLDSKGCTAFLVSESNEGKSPFNVEDFISDGVIAMDHVAGEQSMIRHLNVVKMRGVGYRSGSVMFDITSDGIRVYPKIPMEREVAGTDFQDRLGTGVDGLDNLLDGGYPKGHIVLLTGNTGTGKSTFGMQFLLQGLENDEPCVFVNLEEPTPQIKKTAQSHGWEFESHERKGNLKFITPDLIDMYPDRLLYLILDNIDDMGAKRVFIDSISSIPSADVDEDELRELLLQLNAALKKRGITCVMTHLTSGIFTANPNSLLGNTSASDLRLSSLTDVIILLRYVEEEDNVSKALNVLKMRGCNHSKEIREFTVSDKGIEIGKTFGRSKGK